MSILIALPSSGEEVWEAINRQAQAARRKRLVAVGGGGGGGSCSQWWCL